MNGDRGFKGRRLRSSSKPQQIHNYDVRVNGIAVLRDISWPAAMIAVRGLVRDISFAPLKDHHKVAHPTCIETLPPGEHSLIVGAYTITITHHVPEPEDEDDGVLRCGCIDVCRSNCDGRSRRY
jgi:hypothetical protein